MAEEKHPGHHSHHHGPWDRERLRNLERPEREQLMPRAVIIEEMDVSPGMVVADVGAGLGWLTFPLAVAVGASGRVLAVDPSHDGIAAIRERAQEEKLSQVETFIAPAENTGLPESFIDRILWHTMYHDVGDRHQAIKEMYRILKPGGRWIVVDWVKESTDFGPPESVRMSPDEVWNEVRQVGFHKVREWKAGPVTWGVTLEK